MKVAMTIWVPWIKTPNDLVQVSLRHWDKPDEATSVYVMKAWEVQGFIELQEKARYRITDIRPEPNYLHN